MVVVLAIALLLAVASRYADKVKLIHCAAQNQIAPSIAAQCQPRSVGINLEKPAGTILEKPSGHYLGIAESRPEWLPRPKRATAYSSQTVSTLPAAQAVDN